MMKRFSFALVATFGLIGCGGSGPSLVPVSGTITLNGQPIEAEVLFTPDPSNAAITAGGDTSGPAGNYKAMYGQRSGLSPGKYKVTVTEKIAGQASSGEDAMEEAVMREAMMAAREGAATEVPKAQEEEVPASQTFDIEIEPSGGIYDFDVKSGP